MDKIKLRGRSGEAAAAAYLKKKGYKLLAMNYATRLGEVDIIARDGDFVVFVEVKLRNNPNFAEAREFVTYSKRRKIIATAQLYLQKQETELQPRFDIIEIYTDDGSINHIENAF